MTQWFSECTYPSYSNKNDRSWFVRRLSYQVEGCVTNQDSEDNYA